uniref:Uncharacterized protein n=1 Tax=viral metagenome TaxID=1070528 RepID=A0A6C0CJA3_9ZZZZ
MSRIDDTIDLIGKLVLRTVVSIYHAVEVCIHGRNPVHESMTWSLYDKSGYSTSRDSFHELDVGGGESSFVAHQVRRTVGFQQTYKIAIHWVNGVWRAPYVLHELFDAPPPPWLYIGYGEDTDHLIDCTEELNCLVVYDNHVTNEVLHSIVPASDGLMWYYINPKTFETLEFPANGIVIDDPPSSDDQPEPESATKDD